MAYVRPSSLEECATLVHRPDVRYRQLLGDELAALVRSAPEPPSHDAAAQIVDGLLLWLNGGNFKVAQNGLEAIAALAETLGSEFSAFVPAVVPHIIDRLGDTRECVRGAARAALAALASSGAAQARVLLSRLAPALQHKSAHAREEAIRCVGDLLQDHGAAELQLKSSVPIIAGLVGDPSGAVRDAAFQLLVNVYRHVGDKLRTDLRKKELIPPSKFAALEVKFDEAREAGLLLPSALQSSANDELDNVAPIRIVKRTLTMPTSSRKPANREAQSDSSGGSGASTPAMEAPRKGAVLGLYAPAPPTRRPPTSSRLGSGNSDTGGGLGGGAGAVSAEAFEAAFSATAPAALYGARGLDDAVRHASAIVGDKAADWERRVDALKKIRSVLVAGAHTQYPQEFAAHLKELSVPFLVVIKDLRSQVVREACITIAYMAKTLKNKLDQFSLYILQELINLVPNSAKVISSAGTVCIRYVVSYVHSPRILPVITTNMATNKAKEIRSTLSDVLVLLLEKWPASAIDKQVTAVKEAIRKGCGDAASTARTSSRKAYWVFKSSFPVEAEMVFNQLDPAAQKAIEREQKQGSTDSLQTVGATPSAGYGRIERRTPASPRSPPSSVSASTENLATGSGLGRSTSLRRSPRRASQDRPPLASYIPIACRDRSPNGAARRSVSAVDAAAVQRARARALYSNMARAKLSSGTASLPRSKKSPGAPTGQPPHAQSPEKVRQSRGRPGVSQSTPTSRSSSPSSRISAGPLSLTGSGRRRLSGIPRSLAGSRETSPTRLRSPGAPTSMSSRGRRESLERGTAPQRAPVAAMRMLQQSRDAESQGDDVLSGRGIRDDDSEASSVCSERSVDSYRRHDSLSWSGSQGRLGGLVGIGSGAETPPAPADIVNLCASTLWTERKDGLVHLTNYLNSGRLFSEPELRKLTDLLSKMFVDSHTKVFSLFMDAVAELVVAHSRQLHHWLYLLMSRLLQKLGTELLGSVQTKVVKMLEIVHEYFPAELQLQHIFRFLADSVTVPNIRTKAAAVRFLADLASDYCPPAALQAALSATGTSHAFAVRAIARVAGYAQDARTPDVRSHARRALVALFDCNAPQVTQLMSELPPESQAVVANVVQAHLRRTSSSGSQSPMRGRTVPMDEDVYARLRRTTAEIQSYTSGATTHTECAGDTASKDSGISQMSDAPVSHRGVNGVPNGHYNEPSVGRAASAESSEDANSTKESSPTPVHLTHHYSTDDHGDSYDYRNNTRNKSIVYEPDEDGFITTKSGMREVDAIEALVSLEVGKEPPEQWERLLLATHEILKYGNCKKPLEHFRGILRVCIAALEGQAGSMQEGGSPSNLECSGDQLDQYGGGSSSASGWSSASERCAAEAVRVLVWLCRRPETYASWLTYLDLVLLKLINKYGGSNKEVTRAIEAGMPYVARALPAEQTLALLRSVIRLKEYPFNLCALKLVTEVARQRPSEITDEHLAQLMTGLGQLADHQNSAVRKAAVLCLVGLSTAAGEARMAPFLEELTASKRRLVQVYINKIKEKQSALNKGMRDST